MRILITGGAGFIGQHLARALHEHDLVALDVLLAQVHDDPDAAAEAFPGPVVRGDVAEPLAWEEARALGPYDAVVHLAAETGTAQSMYEFERHRRVNVDGTRLVGAFAAAEGVPLVHLSSRAVYGDGSPRRPSYEDDPHRPVSVYGRTKSEGERVLAGSPVPVSILRPQNVVGPGQSLHNPYTGVLAAFLARLREGLPLQVYGDGTQTRDFVHVRDLVALIVWCLQHPADRVLNCGTGVRTTLLELAGFAVAAAPVDDPGIVHVPVVRAGDIDHACASLARLREVGAPLPTTSTEQAVREFIGWAWDRPGAAAAAWDRALDELVARGLTSGD